MTLPPGAATLRARPFPACCWLDSTIQLIFAACRDTLIPSYPGARDDPGKRKKEQIRTKYFAELVGTFILLTFGCGTAVVAGDKVGVVGIAFAFGFALVGAAYGIGPISGCHINPAVSLGV